MRNILKQLRELFRSDFDRELERYKVTGIAEMQEVQKLFNSEGIDNFIPDGRWGPVYVLGPNLELVEVNSMRHAKMIVNKKPKTGFLNKTL